MTQPVLDFNYIREQLEAPEGIDLLEFLENLPFEQKSRLERKLREIENDCAKKAKIAMHASDLLEILKKKHKTLGIVTRNSKQAALRTIENVELIHHFPKQVIIAREDATPKPNPDGIICLMKLWRTNPKHVVMIGDFLYDLQAGKAAGVATILINTRKTDQWDEICDVKVSSISSLIENLEC